EGGVALLGYGANERFVEGSLRTQLRILVHQLRGQRFNGWLFVLQDGLDAGLLGVGEIQVARNVPADETLTALLPPVFGLLGGGSAENRKAQSDCCYCDDDFFHGCFPILVSRP